MAVQELQSGIFQTHLDVDGHCSTPFQGKADNFNHLTSIPLFLTTDMLLLRFMGLTIFVERRLSLFHLARNTASEMNATA